MNMKKLLKWGLIGLTVIIVISALSGGDKGTPPTNTQESGQTETQRNYEVNEPISTKNAEVTITSAEEVKSVGGQYINEKPSEGATLLAVQWKYKNTSDKPLKSYSAPTIKLLDSSGTEYNSDLGKSSSYAVEIKLDRKVFSDLNPGITVKDAQVFEIGKDAYAKGGWKLEVKADGQTYLVAL